MAETLKSTGKRASKRSDVRVLWSRAIGSLLLALPIVCCAMQMDFGGRACTAPARWRRPQRVGSIRNDSRIHEYDLLGIDFIRALVFTRYAPKS